VIGEKHYSLKELLHWGYSETTLRKLFKNENGVLHLEGEGLMKGTAEQPYDTLSIPESVAQRVYERLQRKSQPIAMPPKRALTLIPVVRRRKSA
jgi:hypothetical protein